MMKLSSTYHLYKIALLMKTVDAAKDSVILRSDESSRALYFIVSGTVEVMQVRNTGCILRYRSISEGKGIISACSERKLPSACVSTVNIALRGRSIS